MTDSVVWTALDVARIEEIPSGVRIIETLKDSRGVKIGSTLFTSMGPESVHYFTRQGISVFLDLKFHDQPDQVVGAVKAAVGLRVSMLTVHATGGISMMIRARQAAEEEAQRLRIPMPKLVAVTMLTGLGPRDLYAMSYPADVSLPQVVLDLAQLAQFVGLDGVVASPKETASIRKICRPDFMIVNPGIRPRFDPYLNDHMREATPTEAIEAGASELVVGRPILRAKPEIGGPWGAITRINNEVNAAKAAKGVV
jgi:orotidine-5'-phosphate decarboxylase